MLALRWLCGWIGFQDDGQTACLSDSVLPGDKKDSPVYQSPGSGGLVGNVFAILLFRTCIFSFHRLPCRYFYPQGPAINWV